MKINIRKLNSRTGRLAMVAILIGAIAVAIFAWPNPAQAHCDSVQGPVVQAAQNALDANDVNLVLPYVQPDKEAELIAAFKQARQVRNLSPQARDLAETFFFETAVRLHRQGEGAVYTGLKDEAVPESIALADQALQSGNLKGVQAMLSKSLQTGLQEKYQAVVHAREQAEKKGTVEAQRERVEAELIFEKYVFEVNSMLSGEAAQAETTAPAGGHTH